MNRADMMGGLADMTLPPEAPSWEAEHRYAPLGSEISQGDAYWMSGGRPLPQRSEADAYRMGGLAAMDEYKPNTFRDIDRADIEDQYGGADLHGIKLPPVSRDEPKAWFDTLVGETPADAAINFGLGGTGRLAKGALALGSLFKLSDPAEAAGRVSLPSGRLSPIKLKRAENWRLDPETPPPRGHNQPPPERQVFPQYAEEYPSPGPPEWRIDVKKDKGYWGKQLTPEVKAFDKERQKVIEDMQRYGYEPFFDVSKRSNVDPTNYPPNVDTTTIIPKKQATIDKHMAEIGSDEARARLQAAYARGKAMPNTDRWYALKQLEDEFIKELGEVEGRKAFQARIATGMAATTGGADPTSNLMMSQYGNVLRGKHPEDVPWTYVPETHQMPYPVGGRYAGGNMSMHEKVFDEGGQLTGRNPKRHNFSQNFTGNLNAATMDEQMTSGMTPGKLSPPAGTYGLYERVLAEEAAKAGVSPAEFQGVGWSGFKNMKDPTYTKGKPFIEHINESIERTHRLTGMPKDEIMRRGLIYGQIPLYAVMGAIGLGATAEQGKYDR